MENQDNNPDGHKDYADGVKRDKKGRWLVGTPSPFPQGGGTVSGQKGFASWRKRIEHLDAKYPLLMDLGVYFTIDQWGRPQPTAAFGQVNPYDAGLIWQKICQTFGTSDQSHKARESFWDRYEGTPTQTIQHRGLGAGVSEIPTTYETDEEAAEALEALRMANVL